MTTHQAPGETCPLCGAAVAPGGDECPACGSRLEPEAAGGPHPLVEAPDGRPSFRLRGILPTIARVALRPERTFAEFRWAGGFRGPLGFVALVGGLSVGLAGVFDALLATGGRSAFPGSGAASFLGVIVLAPIAYVYLRAQIVHLLLVLQGAAARRFEATFRAVAYSNGSVAPSWIVPPMELGGFLFLFWGILVEVPALRSAHRLTLSRALVSVVLPVPGLLAIALLARWTLEVIVPG